MKGSCIGFACILVLLVGCIDFSTVADPLNGTSWEMYAYRKSRPIEGSTLMISFEDGQVRGSAGCNSYEGTYNGDGRYITVSEIFATLMAYPEPEGLMKQEMMFLHFLGDAQRFEIAYGQLQIFGPPTKH